MSDKCGIRMTKCFWCGEADGIMIPKRLSKWDDGYCPPVVISYEPCKKCEDVFKTGVLIMEAESSPFNENQPEIQKGVYPSGNHWVVKEGSLGEHKAGDKMFVDKKTAEEIGLYGDK